MSNNLWGLRIIKIPLSRVYYEQGYRFSYRNYLLFRNLVHACDCLICILFLVTSYLVELIYNSSNVTHDLITVTTDGGPS